VQQAAKITKEKEGESWLAAKGGFQVRSNCKGPRGPPCAVTPISGTKPPTMTQNNFGC